MLHLGYDIIYRQRAPGPAWKAALFTNTSSIDDCLRLRPSCIIFIYSSCRERHDGMSSESVNEIVREHFECFVRRDSGDMASLHHHDNFDAFSS